MKNNLSLRSEKLNADYQNKIKGTAWDISQTTIAAEYGQINSAFTDNKLGISQSIKFPGVYARQKSVLDEEWKNGLLNITVKENTLKKQVTLIYYELLYLQEKQKLLQQVDSLYAAFLQKAEVRFNSGETNILEKATAETQRGQAEQQLLRLEQDYLIVQLQFKLLLNTSTDFQPSENLKIALPVVMDTSIIKQHPYIKQLIQHQQIAIVKYKLEKAQLLPDLFASYNTMTIKGLGPDEKFYTGADRFQSFEVGLGIPIFYGAKKAGIAAMKINKELAQNNYLFGLQTMQTEYQQAVKRYNSHINTVQYYETKATKNADVLFKTANLQFQNGAINYLEWVLLTNNAISIQSDYIEAIRNLNQSVVELNSYNNK